MSNPNPNIYRNVVESLGDASTLTGNFDQAKNHYEIVKGLIGDDTDATAMHYYKLGRLYLYETKLDEAHQSFGQALDLAKTNPGLAAQIEAEIRLLHDMS